MKTNPRIIHWLVLLALGALNGRLASLSATTVTFTTDAAITNTDYDGADIIVKGCTVTIAGSHPFNSLLVTNAGNVAVGGGTTQSVAGAVIVTGSSTLLCQGANAATTNAAGEWEGVGARIIALNLTVDAGSKISADGQGYGGNGQGPGGAGIGDYSTGGSHGGRGSGSGGPTYGSLTLPRDLGSAGGGAFGGWSYGGGAIELNVSGTLLLNGTISAGGQSAGGNNAGGAGGSVLIIAGTLSGSGSISADGNAGLNGGGGGGRVAVYYTDAGGYNGFANCTANGNGGGANGSVAFFDTSVPNQRLVFYQSQSWNPTNQLHYAQVTVTNNATVTLAGGTTLQVDGALTVLNNSTLICPGLNTGAQLSNQWAGSGATIIAPNVTVDAGSKISADGQGYGGNGQGPGGAGIGNYTSGGSYGGRGSGSSGPTYGSQTLPRDLGSAGGGAYGGWSYGGGAMEMRVSGTLLLNGIIAANGQSAGGNNAGGSGGSVLILARTLSGSGSISANGNTGLNGGGGGGRIAVYDGSSSLPTNNISANGANGGGNGSIYFGTIEANVAPGFPVIGTQIVNELTLLTVTNAATNAATHATNAGYALIDPPPGMSIDANGVISWIPQQPQSPGSYTITTVVTNNNSYDPFFPQLTATNQFTVIVKEVNIAPWLSPTAPLFVNELTLLTLTNTATNANIHSIITGYGLLSPPMGAAIDANGVFTWTPSQTQSPGAYPITVIVTNSNPYDTLNPQLTTTRTFRVTVIEVNVAPVLTTVPEQTVNELALLTFTNAATEANIHSTLGYRLVGAPSGMSISPDGVVAWTPQQTQSPATNIVTTIVTNSNPYDWVNPTLAATNTFTVIVREVNTAPVLPKLPTVATAELTMLTVTNTATESNIHSTLAYTLLNPPPGVNISTNGIITWTPTDAQKNSTNTITTAVINSNPYDVANPHLGATNSFTVIVLPSLFLTDPEVISGGQFQFTLNDTLVGTTYTIQCSTNLLNWTPVLEFYGVGGPVTVIDPNAGAYSRQYYRVRHIP